MFADTEVTLKIYTPTLNDVVTQPATATVSEESFEFYDASYFDLAGDPYDVVAASFDIQGSLVHYQLLQSGSFVNVDDTTGFNGYELTFGLLQDDPALSIRNARLLSDYNTLGIPDDFVSSTDNTLRVNVDGLGFSINETVSIILDFRFTGDGGRDVFEGGQGKDVINGKGGADILNGGAGKDKIKGGGGDDFIFGGAGKDNLVGNGGDDIFVLSIGGGTDKIKDFSDGDQILVDTTAEGFSELTFKQKGSDTLIISGGARFQVKNSDVSDFQADDFLF